MALRGIQVCIIELLCRWGGQDHTGGMGYMYISEYTDQDFEVGGQNTEKWCVVLKVIFFVIAYLTPNMNFLQNPYQQSGIYFQNLLSNH